MPGKHVARWVASAIVLNTALAVATERSPSDAGVGDHRRAADFSPRGLKSAARRGDGGDAVLVGFTDEDRPPRRVGERDRRTRRARDVFETDEEPSEVEEAMRFVEEHFPARHRMLTRLRRDEPEAFYRRIHAMMPRIRRIMEVFELNPETGELMLREEQLSMEIDRRAERHLDAGDRDVRARLRREIRTLLVERLEVQLRMRELEIERIERRLDNVKKRLERDQDRRDELIERAMDDLGILIE